MKPWIHTKTTAVFGGLLALAGWLVANGPAIAGSLPPKSQLAAGGAIALAGVFAATFGASPLTPSHLVDAENAKP